jgi:hypothetical protein
MTTNQMNAKPSIVLSSFRFSPAIVINAVQNAPNQESKERNGHHQH